MPNWATEVRKDIQGNRIIERYIRAQKNMIGCIGKQKYWKIFKVNKTTESYIGQQKYGMIYIGDLNQKKQNTDGRVNADSGAYAIVLMCSETYL